MSRLNNPENFAGRVAYAAQVIAAGRATSRAFDNCFENYDGDEVATALLRRSANNPKLAANLFRYLSESTVREGAARLAHIPTRKLAAAARTTRLRRRAESDETSAGWYDEAAAAESDPGKAAKARETAAALRASAAETRKALEEAPQ